VTLRRGDRPDPASNEEAFALLTVAVRDADQQKVGRRFSNAAIEMALASYPGFTGTGPPGDASQVGVFWPALVDSAAVEHRAVVGDCIVPIAPVPLPASYALPPPCLRSLPPPPTGATRAVPLGRLCGARSGDKGGNANVGVWVRTPTAYAWLAEFLTIDRLRALLPEARDLGVERYPLPNLLAVNFVIQGLLGDGVAASLRSDPQAKTLGEYLRAKVVEIPLALLPAAG
jgi:hypothetical protein